MTTPWGKPLATYASRADFYTARPDLAKGWTIPKRSHDGPLGFDVHNSDDFVITLCTPEADSRRDVDSVTGVVTAFECETGEIHVIAEDMTHGDATRRFAPQERRGKD